LKIHVIGFVESLGGPGFLSKELNDIILNAVGSFLVSKSIVAVSNQGKGHTKSSIIEAAHDAGNSYNSEGDWGEVDLDNIEVSHVRNVHEREKANHGVSQNGDSQGRITAHSQSGKGEVKLSEDH